MKVSGVPPTPPKPDVKIVLSEREAQELLTFIEKCDGNFATGPDWEAWLVTEELVKALRKHGIREVKGL